MWTSLKITVSDSQAFWPPALSLPHSVCTSLNHSCLRRSKQKQTQTKCSFSVLLFCSMDCERDTDWIHKINQARTKLGQYHSLFHELCLDSAWCHWYSTHLSLKGSVMHLKAWKLKIINQQPPFEWMENLHFPHSRWPEVGDAEKTFHKRHKKRPKYDLQVMKWKDKNWPNLITCHNYNTCSNLVYFWSPRQKSNNLLWFSRCICWHSTEGKMSKQDITMFTTASNCCLQQQAGGVSSFFWAKQKNLMTLKTWKCHRHIKSQCSFDKKKLIRTEVKQRSEGETASEIIQCEISRA